MSFYAITHRHRQYFISLAILRTAHRSFYEALACTRLAMHWQLADAFVILKRVCHCKCIMQSNFALRSTRIGLTYARCPISPQDALAYIKTLFSNNLKYALVAQEHHKDEGLHLHAYINLYKRQYIQHARFFDIAGYHAHVETICSPKEWIAYCKKGNTWLEDGICPIKEQRLSTKERNQRILQIGIVEAVNEGLVNFQSVPRTICGIEMYRIEESKNSQREKPRVLWFHGSTGKGKTRRAIELGGSSYWISSTDLKWFDGYHSERVAILDDIRTNSCPFNFLLRLLDRYKLNVPIKGGFTFWTPQTIIITCPVAPQKLYVHRETGEEWDHLDQLLRRIDEIRDFDAEPYGSRPDDGIIGVEFDMDDDIIDLRNEGVHEPESVTFFSGEPSPILTPCPEEISFEPILSTWYDGNGNPYQAPKKK